MHHTDALAAFDILTIKKMKAKNEDLMKFHP